MFSNELAEYIRDNIIGLEVFVESFPAPKDSSDQLACVISAGESGFTNRRQQYSETKRIVVTGTAKSAIEKAWDIFYLFLPADGTDDLGFNIDNYIAHTVFVNTKPQFFQNFGNLFYANLVLTFLISRDNL